MSPANCDLHKMVHEHKHKRPWADMPFCQPHHTQQGRVQHGYAVCSNFSLTISGNKAWTGTVSCFLVRLACCGSTWRCRGGCRCLCRPPQRSGPAAGRSPTLPQYPPAHSQTACTHNKACRILHSELQQHRYALEATVLCIHHANSMRQLSVLCIDYPVLMHPAPVGK